VLKLSDEELPLVCEYYGLNGDVIEQLKSLLLLFSLDLIAYTRGPDGSILVSNADVDIHPGCSGKAVNSVGAGDSFLASLASGMLKGRSLTHINDFANMVGTFVCSQDGATPILPEEIVHRL
jgi:fructokinase